MHEDPAPAKEREEDHDGAKRYSTAKPDGAVQPPRSVHDVREADDDEPETTDAVEEPGRKRHERRLLKQYDFVPVGIPLLPHAKQGKSRGGESEGHIDVVFRERVPHANVAK